MDVSVLIVSEAGKPIFVQSQRSEEEIARQCSLLQALRTATRATSTSGSEDSLGLGEMQSLRSGKLLMVFWTVGVLTLIATSKQPPLQQNRLTPVHATEAYLRLQLEYLYSQLISHTTNQVQSILQHNPSYDFRTSLATTGTKLLEGILRNGMPAKPSVDSQLATRASILLGGLPMAFPLAYRWRQQVAQGLQAMGGTKANPNLVFGLLLAHGRLLSLVQPSSAPHHLKASDVHLILNLLASTSSTEIPSDNTDPSLKPTSELWLPICLPRFNSTAFIYAYSHCWDPVSQLTIVLLSSHNTAEEFQRLQLASRELQSKLGLFVATDRPLSVPHPTTPQAKGALPPATSIRGTPLKDHDVSWTRDTDSWDEDYVQIPSNHTKNTSTSTFLEDIQAIAEKSTWSYLASTYDDVQPSAIPVTPPSKASFRAQDPAEQKQIPTSGGKAATSTSSPPLLLHWMCRLETPIHAAGRFGPGSFQGWVGQCLIPSTWHSHLATSIAAQERLWMNYQQLQLRLRLGSATPEAFYEALETSPASKAQSQEASSFVTIGPDCPTLQWAETPMESNDGLAVTYVIEGPDLYLGLSDKNYEIYLMMTLVEKPTPTKSGFFNIPELVDQAQALVRNLQSDAKDLLLAAPLTWKD